MRLLFFFFSLWALAGDCPSPTTPWSYTGPTGPENWSSLSPDYEACGMGQQQSPVDLKTEGAGKAKPMEIDYKAAAFHVENNGHTIQADFHDAGGFSVDGKTYELVQIHFHASSEHLLNGSDYPMEMHMVHQEKGGSAKAVLGVLFLPGQKMNRALQRIWENAPVDGREMPAPSIPLDPAQLLPDNRAFISYPGSLTTPSCCETVAWRVFLSPLEVLPDQISFFLRYYPNSHRPIQPINGRSFDVSP